MDLNELKRLTLAKSRQNPLRSYLWRVELPVIAGFENKIHEISSRVVSFNAPYSTMETDKANDGNSYWYFAKNIDIGNITLEVLEYEDGMSFAYFDEWMKLTANKNKTFNNPIVYKKDVKYFRLDSYKRDIIQDTYVNYFVSSIGELSSDYEGNNLVKYSITLTGDDVVRTKLNNVPVDEDEFLRAINESTQKKKSITEYIFF